MAKQVRGRPREMGGKRVNRRAWILLGVAVAVLSLSALAIAEGKPVAIPSLNDQAKNSPLGSRHWNIFRKAALDPEGHEGDNCIACHSAVAIVDDPKAKVTDFLRAGQKYYAGTKDGKYTYDTVKVDGKYADNELEGITCRVCHVMDKNGLTLRRPDNTCTLCHGRVYNWKTGSGHHTEQTFFEGQGDGYWMPSVHFTLGMRCESCHTMNSIKHDYEPAKPEDVVKTALCLNCHKSADELEKMIEHTKETVEEALHAIEARIKAAKAVKLTDAQKALVAKAEARYNFIHGELSFGVHNPQFAARLLNEAYEALDQAEGKTIPTAKVDFSNLMVYSQAQVSPLGNRHWDMLERTVFNPADPAQDRCIVCHSAVAIVDDPKAKVSDFLAKGQKWCIEEKEVNGEPVFVYAEATQDGKYIKNRMEGITCRVCHTWGADGNVGLRRSKEQTCGLCHGRAFNWNTGSGHHVELAFMKGQGSKDKGVADMPSMKLGMGFACQDCHFMDNTKHDYEPATGAQIAANPKCKSCHPDAAEMDKHIEEIQHEVESAISKLLPRLEKAGAWVAKNPKNAEAKELYTQAKAGVTFVEDDFSEGVHNPDFARALLARSDKLLGQFEAKFK